MVTNTIILLHDDDHGAHDACYVHLVADNHDRGEDDDCHDNHDGNSTPHEISHISETPVPLESWRLRPISQVV